MTDHIFVEGLDGSGKTTLACTLARSSGEVIEPPVSPFRAIRNEVASSASPHARFCFFLASNLHIAQLVRLRDDAKRLIVVRHVWSTVAYFAAQERVPVKEVWNLIVPFLPQLNLPERVVYLAVHRTDQISRIAARDTETDLARSLAASNDLQIRITEAYEEVFRLAGTEVLRFDTTLVEPAALARAVDAALREGGNPLNTRACASRLGSQ